MRVFSPENPYRSLPRSPDLTHLREEAKHLKKLCAAGDQEALGFLAHHRPQPAGAVQLADAQFVLARSYGFKSWVRLKAFVEAQRRTPQERGALLLRALFNDQQALLQELYERRAELPQTDFFLAAALGNVPLVRSMLSAAPEWARRIGGPMQTQPITYVAHARFGSMDETYPARQQQIVTLLLEHGADPNAYVPESARDEPGAGRIPALYGCCRPPGNPEIAQLLLNAGARTDDGESLYHASELQDPRCLELLFAAGVPDKARDYCVQRALDFDNADTLSVYLRNGADPNHLDWALFRVRSMPIIRLLVEHGADLNKPTDDFWLLKRIAGLTPVQVAERGGLVAARDYLLSSGAIDNRSAKDRLIGACARADEPAVQALLQQRADLVGTLNERDHGNLATLAREGRVEAVRLMLKIGFDVEARADDLEATALHYAASNGNVPMLELLLAHRARLDAQHKYGGTALGTALHCAAHAHQGGAHYVQTVRLLIHAGSEVRDDQLAFATANDLDDIADLLKAKGASL